MRKQRILALIGAGVAAATISVVGATGVLAQTPTPASPATAFLAKIAKNLGIDEARLTAAVKQAELQTIDEQQQAGRLTAEQAQRARDRVNQGQGLLPFGHFGPGDRGGPGGRFAHVDAAAAIGITEDQLRAELQSGKSLAEIAAAHNVSRDQLIQRLVDSETKRIDAEVAAGRLTADRANQLKANLRDRISQMVDMKPGAFGPGRGPGRPAGTGQ